VEGVTVNRRGFIASLLGGVAVLLGLKRLAEVTVPIKISDRNVAHRTYGLRGGEVYRVPAVRGPLFAEDLVYESVVEAMAPHCARCCEPARWVGSYGTDMCYCEPCDAFTTGPATHPHIAPLSDSRYDDGWCLPPRDGKSWFIEFDASKIYGIYPDTRSRWQRFVDRFRRRV
jgi:hypothetical protein